MYCESSCTENHFCKDLELVKILGLRSIVHILAEHICTIASNIHFLIKKCTIVYAFLLPLSEIDRQLANPQQTNGLPVSSNL
jgi:hypothetical protein